MSEEMPARSNLFQRLVLEIHRDLGPSWQVSESSFKNDALAEEEREIDITIEGTIGGYPIMISVEAIDRSRPASVTWVDQMIGKHAQTPTDKLVLWSASGFTKAALTKAGHVKIETVSGVPANTPGWAQIARDVVGARVKMVTAKLTPVIYVDMEDGTEKRWEVAPETLLTEVPTGNVAPIAVLIDITLRHDLFRNTILDHAVDGSNNYYTTYNSPKPLTVLCPDGVTRPLKLLVFDVKATAAIRPLRSRSAHHHGRVTTLAETSILNGVFQLVVHETMDAPPISRATHRPLPKKSNVHRRICKTKAKRRSS